MRHLERDLAEDDQGLAAGGKLLGNTIDNQVGHEGLGEILFQTVDNRRGE